MSELTSKWIPISNKVRGIGSVPGLQDSPIPMPEFSAVSEAFPILVSESEQL